MPCPGASFFRRYDPSGMPFAWIRREITQLRRARPGARFEGGHERHRVGNHAVRLALITTGLALMLIGGATFWLPGPNFLIVLVGLVLVAGQWRLAAQWLDRGEVKLRELDERYWEPYPHKRRLLATLWAGGVTIVAVAVYVAYRQGWLPGWLPFVGG